MKHPIPPRPVRPGTLAVRQDTNSRGQARWAIVSAQPLHGSNGLFGYKRGYGESHHGLYAYPFVYRSTALRTARRLMASQNHVGSFVWGAE